jgi:hypothetical protein
LYDAIYDVTSKNLSSWGDNSENILARVMNLVTLDVVDDTASRQAKEMHGFAVLTESQKGHWYVIKEQHRK